MFLILLDLQRGLDLRGSRRLAFSVVGGIVFLLYVFLISRTWPLIQNSAEVEFRSFSLRTKS